MRCADKAVEEWAEGDRQKIRTDLATLSCLARVGSSSDVNGSREGRREVRKKIGRLFP